MIFMVLKNKQPIWGNNFYKCSLINSKILLNLSRENQQSIILVIELPQLMGNGLLLCFY